MYVEQEWIIWNIDCGKSRKKFKEDKSYTQKEILKDLG